MSSLIQPGLSGSEHECWSSEPEVSCSEHGRPGNSLEVLSKKLEVSRKKLEFSSKFAGILSLFLGVSSFLPVGPRKLLEIFKLEAWRVWKIARRLELCARNSEKFGRSFEFHRTILRHRCSDVWTLFKLSRRDI
jgi:hypothetical protein